MLQEQQVLEGVLSGGHAIFITEASLTELEKERLKDLVRDTDDNENDSDDLQS